MKKRSWVAVALAVLAVVALRTATAQEDEDDGTSGPYYYDRISTCEDPCTYLGLYSCLCFRLPELVVEVD